MKTQVIFTCILILLLVTSCDDELTEDQLSDTKITRQSSNTTQQGYFNGQINIAVVSDIHYMDQSLLKNNAENGMAFQYYLAADPKLIQFSDAIFRNVVADLIARKPQILLIPGDLTKDGEKVSHETMANYLQEIATAGIKIYVVPGNHDINNPEAMKYDGDNATPAATITPEEFAEYYAPYGYNNALSRDENSLSYAAEVSPSVWLLAIDANKYEENTTLATVSGRIKPETMVWIKEQMANARDEGATVIGMMHHNLVEHYNNQSIIHPGYVLDNWESTADTLIAAGLNIIFTGHYHANDITQRVSSDGDIYDVETGSLVSTPFPYRLATLKNKEIDISTLNVHTIEANLPGGIDFETYATLFFNGHLDAYFAYGLVQPPYSVPEPVAATIAPLFRNAYLAHLAGDEKMTPQEKAMLEQINTQSPMGGFVLSSLWSEQYPKDNKWHFRVR